MCDFFSFCMIEDRPLYFDAEKRKEILRGVYDTGPLAGLFGDSHTSIAHFHGYKGLQEDLLERWQYNPFTKILLSGSTVWSSPDSPAYKFVKGLDFKTIIPELITTTIETPASNRPPVRESLRRYAESQYPSYKDFLGSEDPVYIQCQELAEGIIEKFRRMQTKIYTPSAIIYNRIAVVVGDPVLTTLAKSLWPYSAYAVISDYTYIDVKDFVAANISTFFDIDEYKIIFEDVKVLYRNGYFVGKSMAKGYAFYRMSEVESRPLNFEVTKRRGVI